MTRCAITDAPTSVVVTFVAVEADTHCPPMDERVKVSTSFEVTFN